MFMKDVIYMLVGSLILFPQILTYLLMRGGRFYNDLSRYKTIKGLEDKNNLRAFVF